MIRSPTLLSLALATAVPIVTLLSPCPSPAQEKARPHGLATPPAAAATE